LDDRFSQAAAAMARQKKADLFLYSPYAGTAFSQSYRHDPRKLLFQFHPHVATERRILREDWTRFSGLIAGALVVENIDAGKTDARDRSDDSWKRADHIVCASSFSRKSLIDAGADAARISVVPYGVDMEAQPPGLPRDSFFHVIFVGSGLQRKGLHHLLLAWQRASLPADSKLTLICRVVEPAFLPLIAATPRVQLIPGLSRAELDRLYGCATLLAMPSLIEGFGQVYLEALGHGLPVLGTAQTGLPDLGIEADEIYSCESGNIEELAETLTRLSRKLPLAADVNERARQCAGRFSWQSFRNRIRELL
jgi:glycosyltransferase involved in cell wall biosynthesis